ncbi:hypothetical protein RSAG8_09972, partial [Rhizoctonia solani AG-8 WAC10335]
MPKHSIGDRIYRRGRHQLYANILWNLVVVRCRGISQTNPQVASKWLHGASPGDGAATCYNGEKYGKAHSGLPCIDSSG